MYVVSPASVAKVTVSVSDVPVELPPDPPPVPPGLPYGLSAADAYSVAVQNGLPNPDRLLDLHDREAQLAAFDELCDLVGIARPPRQPAPPPDPGGLPDPNRLTGANGPEAMMTALTELLTRLGIDPPA